MEPYGSLAKTTISKTMTIRRAGHRAGRAEAGRYCWTPILLETRLPNRYSRLLTAFKQHCVIRCLISVERGTTLREETRSQDMVSATITQQLPSASWRQLNHDQFARWKKRIGGAKVLITSSSSNPALSGGVFLCGECPQPFSEVAIEQRERQILLRSCPSQGPGER